RARVSSLAPGRPLTTFDTVIFETPASRATSLIVTTTPIMPGGRSGARSRRRGPLTAVTARCPLSPLEGEAHRRETDPVLEARRALRLHPAVPHHPRRVLGRPAHAVVRDEHAGGALRGGHVHRGRQLRAA